MACCGICFVARVGVTIVPVVGLVRAVSFAPGSATVCIVAILMHVPLHVIGVLMSLLFRES